MSVCAFDVMRIRRHVVDDNLARAYGGETPRARRRIGRRCYQELAVAAFELAALVYMSPDELVAACKVEGLHRLEELHRAGKGCILVTGHLGNWEYLAGSLAARGLPITAVGAPMHNPAVDRWIHGLRSRFGMDLIRTGRASGRACLKALRAGRMLLLLIDQDARTRGVFVDFFSTQVSTHTGVALLSLHTGLPIVPCRITREGDSHVVHVYSPLDPARFSDRDGSVRLITQEVTTMLEMWIRERPSAWFWPHRRFKTRPPAGALPFPREGDRRGTDAADHQA
jgi:KDO2-lipid IV(A) lauroyltransferase